MQKKKFYTELSYLLGIAVLAVGTAMMAVADFGVSMVVAPAYIIYAWLSQYWSFMTFGIAEYMLQAVILIIMMLLVRRFKLSYLFSFVTTIIYGIVLDLSMLLFELFPSDILAVRIPLYVVGFITTSAGVALLFNTYISPAAYELFVKEVSVKFGFKLSKFKTVYDCTSCVIAIIMSFLCFGLWKFVGVNIGTIICALLNGWLISLFSAFYNKHWEMVDAFPKLKKFFE